MSSKVAPFAFNVPIVDDKGNPTPFFQRQLQQLLKEKAVTDATVDTVATTAAGAQTAADAAQASAGAAQADINSLDLDRLTDVDTTTTPPTDGQALVFDAASSLWLPGTVAGGGSGAKFTPLRSYDPQVNGNFSANYYGGVVSMLQQSGSLDAVQYYAQASASTAMLTPAIYAMSQAGAGALLAKGPTVAGEVAGLMTLLLDAPLAVAAGDVILIGYRGRVAATHPASTTAARNRFWGIANDIPENPAPAQGSGAQGWGSMWARYV